jgi:hypothetical protein
MAARGFEALVDQNRSCGGVELDHRRVRRSSAVCCREEEGGAGNYTNGRDDEITSDDLTTGKEGGRKVRDGVTRADQHTLLPVVWR